MVSYGGIPTRLEDRGIAWLWLSPVCLRLHPLLPLINLSFPVHLPSTSLSSCATPDNGNIPAHYADTTGRCAGRARPRRLGEVTSGREEGGLHSPRGGLHDYALRWIENRAVSAVSAVMVVRGGFDRGGGGRGAWWVGVACCGATCARGAGGYAVRGRGRACDAVVRWGGVEGVDWVRGGKGCWVRFWGGLGRFFLGRGGLCRWLVEGRMGWWRSRGGCGWIGGLWADLVVLWN